MLPRRGALQRGLQARGGRAYNRAGAADAHALRPTPSAHVAPLGVEDFSDRDAALQHQSGSRDEAAESKRSALQLGPLAPVRGASAEALRLPRRLARARAVAPLRPPRAPRG